MDKATVLFLNRINASFYQQVSTSFSETRANPWEGWKKAMDEIEAFEPDFIPHTVIDFACGNLRFEKFLLDRIEHQNLMSFHTLDNCTDLVSLGSQKVSHHNVDIVAKLADGTLPGLLKKLPEAELTVSFGFFHHVPSFKLRKELLAHSIDATKAQGYIVISLWQFMGNEKLAAKALDSTRTALPHLVEQGLSLSQFEENDWFLGWQESGALRYCHHFVDEEVHALVDSVSHLATLIADFKADGKDGTLNRYLILRKLPESKVTSA